MQKRFLPCLLTAAVLAVVTPMGAAAGQGDAVIGGARDAFGANVIVSARSDPNGANPSGHINATLPSPGSPGDTFQVRIKVTCVAVAGNLAAVGGIISESSSNDNPPGSDFVVVFRDSGLAGGEDDAVEPLAGAPAALCADFVPLAAAAPPILSGNITVNDAA